MARPSPKARWKKAWHLTRQMDRFEMDNDHARLKIHPDMAKAVDYAQCATDKLEIRKPGLYLGMINRKRDAIARGVYWPGHFVNAHQWNCRCVAAPVIPFPSEVGK